MARFDWARAWMEEWGSPALEEGDLQTLLVQVFSLTLYFLHPTLHLCLLPIISLRLLNLFFSRGCVITSGQLPAVGGEVPVAGARVPGGQRPLEN